MEKPKKRVAFPLIGTNVKKIRKALDARTVKRQTLVFRNSQGKKSRKRDIICFWVNGREKKFQKEIRGWEVKKVVHQRQKEGTFLPADFLEKEKRSENIATP